MTPVVSTLHVAPCACRTWAVYSVHRPFFCLNPATAGSRHTSVSRCQRVKGSDCLDLDRSRPRHENACSGLVRCRYSPGGGLCCRALVSPGSAARTATPCSTAHRDSRIENTPDPVEAGLG